MLSRTRVISPKNHRFHAGLSRLGRGFEDDREGGGRTVAFASGTIFHQPEVVAVPVPAARAAAVADAAILVSVGKHAGLGVEFGIEQVRRAGPAVVAPLCEEQAARRAILGGPYRVALVLTQRSVIAQQAKQISDLQTAVPD